MLSNGRKLLSFERSGGQELLFEKKPEMGKNT